MLAEDLSKLIDRWVKLGGVSLSECFSSANPYEKIGRGGN